MNGICPMCGRAADLNQSGKYRVHRIRVRGRWSYCPLSGSPVPSETAVAR